MAEMQNMQNTQQEQATQQQQKETYVNKQKYIIETTMPNGVLGATISVQFTANLVKELLSRNMVFYYTQNEIINIVPRDEHLTVDDIKKIIKEAAIKKALETNKQSDYYNVVLDVNDVVQQIDNIIKQRIEDAKRIEEEKRRIEEEKARILNEINQKIEELKEIVLGKYIGCVEFIDGTKIYFSKGDSLEELKKALEAINNINKCEVFKNVIKKLEKEREELKEENSKLYDRIGILERVIKKLVSEEELKEKLEELEEKEEEELTKEEIKYLLDKVF
jgi:hypothetical protein